MVWTVAPVCRIPVNNTKQELEDYTVSCCGITEQRSCRCLSWNVINQGLSNSLQVSDCANTKRSIALFSVIVPRGTRSEPYCRSTFHWMGVYNEELNGKTKERYATTLSAGRRRCRKWMAKLRGVDGLDPSENFEWSCIQCSFLRNANTPACGKMLLKIMFGLLADIHAIEAYSYAWRSYSNKTAFRNSAV